MRVANGFTFFWGGVFSNWHPAKFTAMNVEFSNSEQYFMVLKGLVFNDNDSVKQMILSSDPKKVKALGRKVNNFNPLVWDEVKYESMYEACYQKFTQNPAMLKQLFDTVGTELVEASPYDKVWGIGLEMTNDRVLNKETWNGQNLLGQVLTQLRDNLIAK